jgi:hypothetical protein
MLGLFITILASRTLLGSILSMWVAGLYMEYMNRKGKTLSLKKLEQDIIKVSQDEKRRLEWYTRKITELRLNQQLKTNSG